MASRLDAPVEAVWERVTSRAGIADEMRPILRMTLPEIERIEPGDRDLGRPLGRCWLLLFGVLPIDYDDLTLLRFDPGRGFHERSAMLTQRVWEHRRTLREVDGGCLITDRLRWEPRLGLPGRPLQPLIAWFFGHRHRRLRRRFGGVPVSAP